MVGNSLFPSSLRARWNTRTDSPRDCKAGGSIPRLVAPCLNVGSTQQQPRIRTMYIVAPRGGRSRLALSLLSLAVLAACADEPVAPKTPPARASNSVPPTGDFVEVTVTNASGGFEVGSLRWAAGQSHSAGGAIKFDPSLDGATITLGGPVSPDGPAYFVGPAKGITISGNDQHRVISSQSQVSMQNVTITKGYSADYASAIKANSVYLDNSTVQDNRGTSAIRVIYTLSLRNTTISRNVTSGPAVEYGASANVFLDNSP